MGVPGRPGGADTNAAGFGSAAVFAGHVAFRAGSSARTEPPLKVNGRQT